MTDANSERTKLKVITSGAFAAALEGLVPLFEAKYPVDVDIAYGSSLDVVGALGQSASDVAMAFSLMAGCACWFSPKNCVAR